jgi:hypothetical protein
MAYGADKKVVVDKNGNATVREETADEKSQRLAHAQNVKELTDAQNAIVTQNRSNIVNSVNTALTALSLSNINSRTDVTLAWKTNIHASVNLAYNNAPAANKDDILLNAVHLYENIATLLLIP